MSTWLATTPLGTALKTFVAVVLSLAVADFVSSNTVDLAHWQTWIVAGLASAIPVVVNWINPSDPRYGRGSAAPDA